MTHNIKEEAEELYAEVSCLISGFDYFQDIFNCNRCGDEVADAGQLSNLLYIISGYSKQVRGHLREFLNTL